MSVGQITPNYSFYAIPAFYILIISPHFYGTFHITKATNGNFDNANPRGQNCATLLKKIVPHDTLALFERAKAAHQNGLENLPLFASAVIIANIAKVDTETLNAVCAMFLVLRAVYIPIYIGITSRKLAWSRTGVFAASVCCCMYLLVKAGGIIASGESLMA